MAKPTIVTPAQFLTSNPKEVIDADKALKQINDNLKNGKLVTVFSGKDQVNPLGKNYVERLAIIQTEFSAAGWTVAVTNDARGTTITLSAEGV